MRSTEPYFNQTTLHLVDEARALIDTKGLWQLSLLNENGLSRDAKEKKLTDFSGKDIRLLWRIGLLTADSLCSPAPLSEPGLVQSEEGDGTYVYQDHRTFVASENGLENAFSKAGDDPYPEVSLFFHPFRGYLLYRLYRGLCNRVVSRQYFTNSNGFSRLGDLHVADLKSWFKKDSTATVINNINALTDFCVACEPPAHRIIFGRVISSGLLDFEDVAEGLAMVGQKIRSALSEAGKPTIEHCRRELCQMSEELDPNKNLHLIVRLMKATERERLKGRLAGAMLFFHMAEALRRNFEEAVSEKLPEEDEMGFGSVSQSAKQDLQGAVRILDGQRLDANQFLRRFGLDYGIRVNVYVEGATERAIMESEFDQNSSVLVIDLKGQFVESRSKGLSFRESLENDIRSKTFSLIMLDADRVDNIRVVLQAAREDLICGQFYLCNPDVEFANFTADELCAIVRGSYGADLAADIETATAACRDAKNFFKTLASVGVQGVEKGKVWGAALHAFARRNPRGDFGENTDRLINRLLRTVHQCCSFTYETTRQRFKVDPGSGQLVPR